MTAELGEKPPGGRLLARAAGLCLLVGLLWRGGRYLMQFPIWGDEAFILVNLLDRDYLGLIGPLTYSQVAPLLFLWAEETAFNLLGSSEWAVRFFPFLAGMLAVLLFAWCCRRSLPPLTAALAMSLLAVSYYPVRHACEVKPYAFDLLMSVGFLVGALGWLREPNRTGWLVFLVLWTPFALVSSYPAVFVAGSVGLVLLAHWRAVNRTTRGLIVLFQIVTVLAFLGHYGLIGRQQVNTEQASATHDFMQDYWQDAFPPVQPWHIPAWLLETHTGHLFAYPLGGGNGGSTLSFLLALLGGFHLARQRKFSLLALCLLPFVLSLLAAALHKYPYGGSPRLTQHLAPAICLLMAAGLTALLLRLREPRRWATAICLLLALFGSVSLVRDLVRPYKTEHEQALREAAAALWREARPDDAILVCNARDDVFISLTWYLRREGRPIVYLDDVPRQLPPASRFWLLHLLPEPASTEQLRSHLGMTDSTWTAADHQTECLPREQRDQPPYHFTRLLLERAE